MGLDIIMLCYEMFNNIVYCDLCVVIGFGFEFGDVVGMVLVYLSEFVELQCEYFIFLCRDLVMGDWQFVVLFGFEQYENLFLYDGCWNVIYLLGVVVKGLFFIGFQENWIDGVFVQEVVLYVDFDYLCVNVMQGELVFLLQGGNSFYFDYIVGVLCGIYDGYVFGVYMFFMFDMNGFIELVLFDVMIDIGYWVGINGLYVIDCDCLVQLDGFVFVDFNCVGYLEGVYLMLVFLYNMWCLIVEKQCCLCMQDVVVVVGRN